MMKKEFSQIQEAEAQALAIKEQGQEQAKLVESATQKKIAVLQQKYQTQLDEDIKKHEQKNHLHYQSQQEALLEEHNQALRNLDEQIKDNQEAVILSVMKEVQSRYGNR